MTFHDLPRVRWRTVLTFWLSTLLLTGAWAAYVRWHGVPPAWQPWLPGVAQWAVLVAAILAIVFTARGAWRTVGWSCGPLSSYLAVGIAVPATVAAIHAVGMEMGAVEFVAERADAMPLALFIPIVLLVSCLTSFGEEFGWRGLLLPQLLPLGRVKALVLSGLVWATFEALLVAFGLLSPALGAAHLPLAMLSSALGTVAIAVIFGALRLR